MLTLAYPAIDPVLVQIGPLAIRWYALAYIAGILLAWRYMILLAPRTTIDRRDVDDFMVWGTLGVIAGGRLGYVLFYKPGHYLDHPLDALALWQGGMSFHGGLLGVVFAVWLFARRRGYHWVALGDLVCCATPIGLFLGRLANFINGELYGRTTDSPLGMVFPGAGPLPRHPSQLYEAFLEGPLLLAALFWLSRREGAFSRRGFLSGAFFAGYGIARTIAEAFREPDAHIGFLAFGTTMGQWLSLPVLAAGIWLIATARRHDSA